MAGVGAVAGSFVAELALLFEGAKAGAFEAEAAWEAAGEGAGFEADGAKPPRMGNSD